MPVLYAVWPNSFSIIPPLTPTSVCNYLYRSVLPPPAPTLCTLTRPPYTLHCYRPPQGEEISSSPTLSITSVTSPPHLRKHLTTTKQSATQIYNPDRLLHILEDVSRTEHDDLRAQHVVGLVVQLRHLLCLRCLLLHVIIRKKLWRETTNMDLATIKLSNYPTINIRCIN